MLIKEEKVKQNTKILLTAIPIAISLAVVGTALAVISIIAPTSLNYEAAPANNTMQSFTTGDCMAMQTYTTVTLRDTRDNTNYRVRKMPDGKCWMVDNLKLAGGITLNSSNTDLDDTTDAAFIADWKNKTTQATGTNSTQPTWLDPGNSIDCQPGEIGVSSDSLTGCGYLYNWLAATAGTGTYTMSTGDASSSICAAGWRLPTGGDGTATIANEFAVLNGAMSGSPNPTISDNATTKPNWYKNGPFEGTYAGELNVYGMQRQGTLGTYWTSSVGYSSSEARVFSFQSNAIYVATDNQYDTRYKYCNFSVRCLLN